MWVCSQGRRVAAELVEKDFSGHLVVEHVLNIHMQRHDFMKDEWEKEKKTLDGKYKLLNNDVSGLRTLVDKLLKKK